jgi:carbamoylphosphate synthase small subunit
MNDLDEFKLPKFFESDKIHASGVIVGEYCENYSHWNAVKSLSEWLIESNVPAISGIDTRKLTKILREKGSMLAKVDIVYFYTLAKLVNFLKTYLDIYKC